MSWLISRTASELFFNVLIMKLNVLELMQDDNGRCGS